MAATLCAGFDHSASQLQAWEAREDFKGLVQAKKSENGLHLLC